METNTEQQIMGMILHSGEANKKAFAALAEVRKRDFEQARVLIKEASAESVKAHKIQTKLIQKDAASEEKLEMSLLVVHAQDHLMKSLLTIDLIEELIEVFSDLHT
ncbi:PTS lactose/cellobiose transporter subunit IIA [Paenibacillus barcinonensis]|uniref:PTS lactose/cellobiose transporter subunit IIA n=1 Tax=Paenibacillus barcinonensis TaxID=198119 RepID=A0A2V4VQZ1_PAEBA|nr:PTS lactose/cellobiose transporter subunit IIA [Paenibacillus barcinonensis]PYE49030.1 PTS system cellobiose-specific IIA component [Paenibacillus barcinonensis]QKS55285.1 PTS lactose/cellobiose transporter subunit IIA [Paenibacillus barcinonensis]